MLNSWNNFKICIKNAIKENNCQISIKEETFWYQEKKKKLLYLHREVSNNLLTCPLVRACQQPGDCGSSEWSISILSASGGKRSEAPTVRVSDTACQGKDGPHIVKILKNWTSENLNSLVLPQRKVSERCWQNSKHRRPWDSSFRSSLIWVYTSTVCPNEQSNHGLHCLPRPVCPQT